MAPQVWLHNLSKSNPQGTRVNGAPVEINGRRLLQSGDVVAINERKFRFESAPAAAEADAARALQIAALSEAEAQATEAALAKAEEAVRAAEVLLATEARAAATSADRGLLASAEQQTQVPPHRGHTRIGRFVATSAASNKAALAHAKEGSGAPGAPRALSAYNVFMKAEVAKVKAANPDLLHRDAFKQAAEGWQTSPMNPQNGGERFPETAQEELAMNVPTRGHTSGKACWRESWGRDGGSTHTTASPRPHQASCGRELRHSRPPADATHAARALALALRRRAPAVAPKAGDGARQPVASMMAPPRPKVLNAAVAAIGTHFAQAAVAGSGKSLELLGNDQKNKEIAVLVRGQLCTALSRVLLHGFKSFKLIGRYHIWARHAVPCRATRPARCTDPRRCFPCRTLCSMHARRLTRESSGAAAATLLPRSRSQRPWWRSTRRGSRGPPPTQTSSSAPLFAAGSTTRSCTTGSRCSRRTRRRYACFTTRGPTCARPSRRCLRCWRRSARWQATSLPSPWTTRPGGGTRCKHLQPPPSASPSPPPPLQGRTAGHARGAASWFLRRRIGLKMSTAATCTRRVVARGRGEVVVVG